MLTITNIARYILNSVVTGSRMLWGSIIRFRNSYDFPVTQNNTNEASYRSTEINLVDAFVNYQSHSNNQSVEHVPSASPATPPNWVRILNQIRSTNGDTVRALSFIPERYMNHNLLRDLIPHPVILAIFGIDENTRPEDVTTALGASFRALSFIYHPDRRLLTSDSAVFDKLKKLRDVILNPQFIFSEID